MSEPIHDRLIAEGEELAHRARTFLARHLHHDQEEPAMQITADLKADLSDGLAYVEGWVARVKQAAPGLVADAQRLADSPITKALEEAGALIDGPAEAVIAGWITDLATLKLGSPTPESPAEPAA